MHAQRVRTTSRLLVTLAAVGVALVWCPRSSAVGVPKLAEPDVPAPAADSPVIPEATEAVPTGPVPERLLTWEFSYKGRRIKVEGTVLTRAQPSPDGTYEIVSITGKRNKRDIQRLVPKGELMTMYGLLFSDNRLWGQPPYLTQSGFTFHTARGIYFNVCYTGPYEGCGDITSEDFRSGYYEADFKGMQRPIEFTLKRTDTIVVAVVQPLEQDLPLDVIQTCDPDETSRAAVALAAAGTMASFNASGDGEAPSADLRCAPPELEKNRL
jgi:hypothetical protein